MGETARTTDFLNQFPPWRFEKLESHYILLCQILPTYPHPPPPPHKKKNSEEIGHIWPSVPCTVKIIMYPTPLDDEWLTVLIQKP